jgi:UDP-4-amino-4-deoxy-L-arabinose-oxoglutarate aminotransferase
MKVEFYKHSLDEQDIVFTNDTMRSLFLTTGPKTEEFEQTFASYLGVKHVVGVTSCTAALFLTMRALNIGPGDEVITTPLTFAATISSIMMVGATPVLVDVDHNTGNINPMLIEEVLTTRTRAIIPVHLYGNMCDMQHIKYIANKYKLHLIEDSAHCIEGTNNLLSPGNLSDAACFSFYATKNMTCGEGGTIATNNEYLYNKLKKLRCHGITKSIYDRHKEGYNHWDIDELGYKFNMNDIQASLLLSQLPKLKDKLCRRQEIYYHYFTSLNDLNLDFPRINFFNKSALHLFTIWVNPAKRDTILTKLVEKNIGVGVHYRPVHQLSYFRQFFPHSFPSAEKIGASTISLPFYPSLTNNEVDYVINNFREIYLESN